VLPDFIIEDIADLLTFINQYVESVISRAMTPLKVQPASD
jgi:hypothetical protein